MEMAISENFSIANASVQHLESTNILWETICFTVAVLTNSCLLVQEARVWCRRQCINQPKLLIIFLAATELFIMLLAVAPGLIIFSLIQCMQKSCEYAHFVFKCIRFCGHNFSKCTIVLMGFERYLSIQKPFFYDKYCTLRAFMIVLICLALYSLGLAAFATFTEAVILHRNLMGFVTCINCNFIFLDFSYNRKLSTSPENTSDIQRLSFILYVELIQDSAFLVVLCVCNMSVKQGLFAMEKRMTHSCPRRNEKCRRQMDLLFKTGREFSRVLTAMFIVFLIVTLPQLVRIVCRLLDTWPSLLADFIARRIMLSGGAINPFLYGLLRQKIRKRIWNQLAKICACLATNRVAPNIEENDGISIHDSRY